MNFRKNIFICVVLLFSFSSSFSQNKPPDKLINTPAPDWAIDEWINSEPLSLAELDGKVILIRWWLETCPYCIASAPALNEFYEEYSDKGLVVIGMYHPKPFGREVSLEEVREFVQAKEFEFPIAVDEDWSMLRKYWLDSHSRAFTSVSFIIDRKGFIRYIHPGGSYNMNSLPFNDPQWKQDYYEVKGMIEDLLKEG